MDFGNTERSKSMSKYIKREDAVKKLAEMLYDEPPYIDSDVAIKRWAEEQMADVSSIDIVHCKECIHNGSIDTDCPFGWRDKKFNMPNPNDYCSWGERKGGANGE